MIQRCSGKKSKLGNCDVFVCVCVRGKLDLRALEVSLPNHWTPTSGFIILSMVSASLTSVFRYPSLLLCTSFYSIFSWLLLVPSLLERSSRNWLKNGSMANISSISHTAWLMNRKSIVKLSFPVGKKYPLCYKWKHFILSPPPRSRPLRFNQRIWSLALIASSLF